MTSSLADLGGRYGLSDGATEQLRLLLDLLVDDPLAPTSIRTPAQVLNDHLADSLVALECQELSSALRVLDLGAGAGMPGLPLAIASPETQFTLLEASARKCRFLERAVEHCRVVNAEVVNERAESFHPAPEPYDVVLARAVASPPVTAEYGAPLLRVGAALILWHGRREPEVDAALSAAAAELGLDEPSIRRVQPYPAAQNRHLYVLKKLSETPARFPRRPGMALKRPLGGRTGHSGRTGHGDESSDRAQR